MVDASNRLSGRYDADDWPWRERVEVHRGIGYLLMNMAGYVCMHCGEFWLGVERKSHHGHGICLWCYEAMVKKEIRDFVFNHEQEWSVGGN